MKEELPFAHDRWMGIGSMKKGKKVRKIPPLGERLSQEG